MEIRENSPFLKILSFKPYRYKGVERQAEQFLPEENDPPTKEIKTPWGATLMAAPGDYIVHDKDNPEDTWVVEKNIFNTTYIRSRAGLYVKKSHVLLVPLTEVTGHVDEEVVIYTKEGAVTVRSGDFYLARGVEGEIWPVPKEKVGTDLIPVEHN